MISKEAFATAKEQIKEAKKKAQDLVKEVFKEGANSVFEELPDLQSFGWNQYTPYFNDGDACTFRCNSGYPTITVLIDGKESSINVDYGEYDGEEFNYRPYEKVVTAFLENFDDDDFLFMFDDHATVTVNRDGKIDIDEYEHD